MRLSIFSKSWEFMWE